MRANELWVALAGEVYSNSYRKAAKRSFLANSNLAISTGSIRSEVAEFLKPREAAKHDAIFGEILDNLSEVDFFAEAGLKEGEKVAEKHQVVITVRKVLEVARSLNLALRSQNGFLYSYNGEFWSVIEKEDLERFLSKCAAKLGVRSVTAVYHKFAAELYRQFVTVAGYASRVKPSDTVLINLRNGTFEVKGGRVGLRSFNRDDFLTYQLQFDYNDAAACPRWRAFLDEVLPDKSCQDVLAEYIGYVFARHLKLEKTLILYGTGANGKSVVFDVVKALLGAENVTHYSLENLCGEYYRAMLADKLLNYSSEISARLEADKFKQLTSGEPIEARHPYGRPMTLTNYARLAFSTNVLPSKDVEHTEAFFRRFLIVPFDVTVEPAKRNPTLASEIIESELSGVFNWMLEGLHRILANRRFSNCEAAARMVATFKKESDSVAMFLEDENYQPSSKFTTLREIYDAYKAYCSDTGHRALGRTNFAKRLESKGYSRQDRNQPVFFIEKMPRLSI